MRSHFVTRRYFGSNIVTPLFLITSTRFARIRAPPSSDSGVDNFRSASKEELQHHGGGEIDDELLLMGLRPLAEDQQMPDANSQSIATTTTAPGRKTLMEKSNFEHFFRKTVQDNRKTTPANHQKQKNPNSKLFADLMSDLNEINIDDDANSTKVNEGQQPRKIIAALEQQQKTDSSPEFEQLLQFSQNKSKKLEILAPELERMQRNRSFLIRKWAKQDVAEIVRRRGDNNNNRNVSLNPDNSAVSSSASSSPSNKILNLLDAAASGSNTQARDEMRSMVISEVDPLEGKAREETVFHFQNAVTKRANELLRQDLEAIQKDGENGDDLALEDYYEEAAFELIEGMSDGELQVIVKSGALDLGSLWEGNAEFSQLPNEYLTNENLLQLTRELTEVVQPQLPSDDEARIILNMEKDDREKFTDKDLKILENFERRQSYSYVEQPNLVLRTLAREDEKIRQSLETMDRAKRLLLRDAEFQKALAYVQRMERQEIEDANVSPKMRKSAAEVAVPFFDKGHSRPPAKAQTAVPPPAIKDKKHDPETVARMRDVRRNSKQMFTEKKFSKNLGKGENAQDFERWYD